jgi:hypothetical protein|tara:strand:- start:1652 stop:2098 length:447 start_codon:yes stop_codon:yes gene_type:complete
MKEPKDLIEECKKHLRDSRKYEHEYKKDIRKLITALEKSIHVVEAANCDYENFNAISDIRRNYKTIFITKSSLCADIKHIGVTTPPKEREKIYNDFYNSVETEISINISIVSIGGVRYKKNDDKIKVIFIDDIDEDRKKLILLRMNLN